MINEEEQKDRPPTEDEGLPEQEEEKRRPGNPGSAEMQQQPQDKSGEATMVRKEQPRPEAEGATDQPQARPSRARTPRGPHPSLWPFVLALAFALVCLGVVTHPVVLVIGAGLILVAAVGWGLERY